MRGFVRRITRTVKKVAKASPVLRIAKTLLKPQKQGIELAKSVDNKVGEIQKNATNVVKGPSTLEMLADTKRRGRRSTMLTSAKGIQDDYKLSKKSILG